VKIGLFDSGQGGVEILTAVRGRMPAFDYLYYGDTAHVPYGDKTEEEVYQLTKYGVNWLFAQGAVLVIVACNTASAETVRRLQQELLPQQYPTRKVLGVIIPTVETIIESGATSITLLGTVRTIESRKYELELAKLGSTVKLTARATPELVPLLEKRNYQHAVSALETILETVPVGEMIVMGCTHYSILDNFLSHSTKQKYQFLYQTNIIPEKLRRYLEKHKNIKQQLSIGGTVTQYFTQLTNRVEGDVEISSFKQSERFI
jgi:glutamate racemase